MAWQPSIYPGWLQGQNLVKYAMLEKNQLFRIFDNVSSKCLGLVVKETVCPHKGSLAKVCGCAILKVA